MSIPTSLTHLPFTHLFPFLSQSALSPWLISLSPTHLLLSRSSPSPLFHIFLSITLISPSLIHPHISDASAPISLNSPSLSHSSVYLSLTPSLSHSSLYLSLISPSLTISPFLSLSLVSLSLTYLSLCRTHIPLSHSSPFNLSHTSPSLSLVYLSLTHLPHSLSHSSLTLPRSLLSRASFIRKNTFLSA